MGEISQYVGAEIRKIRRAQKMTLQELADGIHKSRATVCKYENGEISADVETLYEISQVLGISVSQLTKEIPGPEIQEPVSMHTTKKSPFFQAKRLYFYFFDGRYNRVKDGVIDIVRGDKTGTYCATLTVCAVAANGRSSEIYYTGSVVYSDMLIRFSFVNQCNPLEEDLLYIFNPMEMRGFTDGLLCGISSADLMPCAFKCIVTLEPQELTEEFHQRLYFTKEELRRWKKLNMLLVDNRSE